MTVAGVWGWNPKLNTTTSVALKALFVAVPKRLETRMNWAKLRHLFDRVIVQETAQPLLVPHFERGSVLGRVIKGQRDHVV